MVPARYRVQGSITSKALFYHQIPEGAVIIFDDFEMSDDLREVLKNATSDFHTPLRHRSLTTNRDPIVLNLPAKCVWWILSVDNPGDDQVLNRMLIPWIDDSEVQDRKVKERIFSLAAQSGEEVHDMDAIPVVRAMLDEVRQRQVRVRIPFAERIMIENYRNRRNSVMLLDMIRSYAVLHFLQRTSRTLSNGMIEIDADERDFNAAAQLFTGLDTTGGGQTSKLLRSEKMLLDTVIRMKVLEFTISQLQQWTGFTFNHIYRILNGRMDKDRNCVGGLLMKCPALGVIDTIVSEDDGDTVRRRRANHYLFDFEHYRRWDRGGRIWLSPDSPADPKRPDPVDPVRNGNGSTNGSILNPDRNALSSVPGSETQDITCTAAEISHRSENTHDASDRSSQQISTNVCACDPEKRVNEITISNDCSGKSEKPSQTENLGFPIIDPSGIPTGQRETKPAGKNAREATGIIPLPGLFDYRDFDRLRVPNGKCDVCSVNPGVFRNEKTRTYLCEICYGRLVRDANAKEQGCSGAM
jgi:hypothetical protein